MSVGDICLDLARRMREMVVLGHNDRLLTLKDEMAHWWPRLTDAEQREVIDTLKMVH